MLIFQITLFIHRASQGHSKQCKHELVMNKATYSFCICVQNTRANGPELLLKEG